MLQHEMSSAELAPCAIVTHHGDGFPKERLPRAQGSLSELTVTLVGSAHRGCAAVARLEILGHCLL